MREKGEGCRGVERREQKEDLPPVGRHIPVSLQESCVHGYVHTASCAASHQPEGYEGGEMTTITL